MRCLMESFPKLFEKPAYWPDGLEWPLPVAPLGPVRSAETPKTPKKQPNFRAKDRGIHAPILAGILLWLGEIDQSHEISQGLDDLDGAYWHGLMHRREPDHSNAAYWFRRVGGHPIHVLLGKIINGGNWQSQEVQKRSRQSLPWDMTWMNDLCRRALRSGPEDLVKDLEALQWAEYRLLLDHSAGVITDI